MVNSSRFSDLLRWEMQMNRATFTIFNGRFSLTATDTIKNHLLSTENEYYWRPMWLIFILADTSTLLGFFFYLSRVSSFFLEILHLCYRSGIPRNTFIITPPQKKNTDPIDTTERTPAFKLTSIFLAIYSIVIRRISFKSLFYTLEIFLFVQSTPFDWLCTL